MPSGSANLRHSNTKFGARGIANGSRFFASEDSTRWLHTYVPGAMSASAMPKGRPHDSRKPPSAIARTQKRCPSRHVDERATIPPPSDAGSAICVPSSRVHVTMAQLSDGAGIRATESKGRGTSLSCVPAVAGTFAAIAAGGAGGSTSYAISMVL